MTTITKNWTNAKGTEISINIEIGNRGKFSGTLTNSAGTFEISYIAKVQGRTVIPFALNGNGVYQVIDRSLYNQIETALRNAYTETDAEILEGKIYEADRKYRQALEVSPQEATKWLNEWTRLSAELSK